ncbi:MAG: alkaline phosphatase family protein [Bacteroidales bacterium]
MRGKQAKINRLVTSIVMSMATLSALSQAQSTTTNKPSLVVSIVVDQLRSDYIELLQDHFSEEGFNKLVNEAVYISNVDYKIPNIDATAATGILYTGCYPRINGIPAGTSYNMETKLSEPILTDNSVSGRFTTEKYSPSALKVSTISDELRISNASMGYVYSIAPNSQQAVIMAGHAGNSAFWINDKTGNWGSSSYYQQTPAVMQKRNYQAGLTTRLDTTSWTPTLPIGDYPDIPITRNSYAFRYTYPNREINRYERYLNSPLVNSEITSLAIDYIKNIGLGNRGETDMLNLAYTLAPYNYTNESDNRVELQDSYIKLDRDLSRLIKEIDSTVGLDNTLLVISSTGYFNDNSTDEAQYKIPSGDFNVKRTTSLLNIYLMAIYGNGGWVSGFHNNEFYLNRTLIKERGVELSDIRSKTAEFLRKASGIMSAHTLDDIINNPSTDELYNLYNSITISKGADVYISIMPGWRVIDPDNSRNNTSPKRDNSVSTPAFILAPNITPQKIEISTDATIIAPTVCHILRIRSPNGAQMKALEL